MSLSNKKLNNYFSIYGLSIYLLIKNMDCLPNELNLMIFDLLPEATLVIAKLVNKNWNYFAEYVIEKKEFELNDEAIIASLVKAGDLNIIKLTIENNPYFKTRICYLAAEYGQLEILKWARENDYQWGARICTNAARNGHFEILKWARENGCGWNAITCSAAAEAGNLEILKWVRENGCGWNVNTCIDAAKAGHLEILKWAEYNGCKMDDHVYDAAFENDHFEILYWIQKNGYPYSLSLKWYNSKKEILDKHLKIIRWAKDNDLEWYNKYYMLAENDPYLGSDYKQKYHKIFNKLIADKHTDKNTINKHIEWSSDVRQWLRNNDLENIIKWGKIYEIKWNNDLVLDDSIDSIYRVFKWAYGQGFRTGEINGIIYRRIIDEEHYAFLKLLTKMKIKNYGICNYAARTKKFDMMIYMIDNGFEYSEEVNVIYQLYKKVIRLEKKMK